MTQTKFNFMNGVDDYEVLLANYYSCFTQSSQGKVVLKDLEDRFYKRTFIQMGPQHPVDANAILVNEGARSVVIYILSKIEEFELNHRSR